MDLLVSHQNLQSLMETPVITCAWGGVNDGRVGAVAVYNHLRFWCSGLLLALRIHFDQVMRQHRAEMKGKRLWESRIRPAIFSSL